MKISVKVIPGAKKEEVIDEGCDLLGMHHFKVKTSAIAEDGKANKAVIELLAKFFAVKKNAVKIISGEKARNKLFKIDK